MARRADQVTALRLRALGAVNGPTVYVPPAYTRKDVSGRSCRTSRKLASPAELWNQVRFQRNKLMARGTAIALIPVHAALTT